MRQYLGGFLTCLGILVMVAETPGFRIEWTKERRVITVKGRVILEILPPQGRVLAGK